MRRPRPRHGRGLRVRAGARVEAGPGSARPPRKRNWLGARPEAGPARGAGPKESPLAYRYVKIGSPMSIQLKIDAAFGIGTRRHPWLAG
jgi:hypothetical protein